jgi:hypothetical protein
MDEEKVVESTPRSKMAWRWQWIAAIVLIIAIDAAGGFHLPKTHARMLESKAKETLRSIGSAELAYQGTNNKKAYGSFEALKRDQYFQSDSSLPAMSPGYSILLRIIYPGRREGWKRRSKNGIGPIYNYFNATAYPYRPRLLHTFAITEEQELLVFDPLKGNDPANVYSWELVPEE